MSPAAIHSGELPSGSRYVIEVPADWGGVLVLFSKPIPVGPGDPPWQPGDQLVTRLVASGYAVAGSANTLFWPVELAFTDQPDLLDIVERDVGRPRHTIAFGLSIGGIMAAGLVQRIPDRLSGALPMCGNLAGAVGVHNRELDIAFVVRTLLAPDSDLQLVDIAEPNHNLEQAQAILREAQTTAAGRARLALAAAVGNIPGWVDPQTPEPSAQDVLARQRNQFAWYEQVGFLVYFWAREQVERQAGGNPSWNSGVDYSELLATSINRDEVVALYATAELDLQGDLDRLAAAPRVDADPDAVSYLERNIIFSGDLGGVPVVTVHSDGDGLVTPDNEHAYAEVVAAAGQQDLLRQLYVHRGGHCTFSAAEILTALAVLMERIDAGSWPSLEPAVLNDTATSLGADESAMGQAPPTAPAFFEFEPRPFTRPYDSRTRTGASG